MNFFFPLAVTVLAALAAYNAISFYHATGSVWDRFAAAWKGSMTIFTLIWSTVLSLVVSGTDLLSTMTGDPQFAHVGDAIKQAAGPEWAPTIGIVVMALPLILGSIARHRTLAK